MRLSLVAARKPVPGRLAIGANARRVRSSREFRQLPRNNIRVPREIPFRDKSNLWNYAGSRNLVIISRCPWKFLRKSRTMTESRDVGNSCADSQDLVSYVNTETTTTRNPRRSLDEDE